MSRRKTGTVRKSRQGLWVPVITLPNGRQKRLPPCPPGTSEAKARERAAYWSERAEDLVSVETEATPTEARNERRAADKWTEEWFADRERRGLTTVRENRAHWEFHIAPILGDKHPSLWSKEELRALSMSLDEKVQANKIAAKTAINAWGTATRMCDDAFRHKNPSIRCRDDNPARDVRGPDRAPAKAREFLYPSEFLQFIRSPDVPMRWKETVTVAVYTFMRLGEIQCLRWQDVNLDNRTIHIHRATDRRTGGIKATKGRQARRIPIHPHLVPLLERMKARSVSELVLALPSERDMARKLRHYLDLAGVERASLFNVEQTSRRLVFHDMRGTGITWHAIAGTEPLRIQQWAGHTDFETTQAYLVTADAVGRDNFGEPFPTLPMEAFGMATNERNLRINPAQVPFEAVFGGADGTRTRGLRRDRPAL